MNLWQGIDKALAMPIGEMEVLKWMTSVSLIIAGHYTHNVSWQPRSHGEGNFYNNFIPNANNNDFNYKSKFSEFVNLSLICHEYCSKRMAIWGLLLFVRYWKFLLLPLSQTLHHMTQLHIVNKQVTILLYRWMYTLLNVIFFYILPVSVLL